MNLQPNVRSWAAHASEGWYIGPAVDSYRCFKVWMNDTRASRISDTVTFCPTKVHAPFPTTEDAIITAAHSLADALKQDDAGRTLHWLHDDKVEALKNLANIIGNKDQQASVDPPSKLPVIPEAAPVPRVAPEPAQHGPTTSKPIASDPIGNPQQAFSLVTSDDDAPRLEFGNDGEVFLHMCNKAFHPDTGKLSEYEALRHSSEGAIWEAACAKEMGRLSQGLPPELPQGRNTIRFIRKADVPKGRKVTYLRIVSTYRPTKVDKHRVRFTVGGNLLDYPGNTSTRTSDLTTYKIMVNSVLSTKDAKAVTIDLSDFYLCTNLDEPEYMRIHISKIPQRVIDYYNLLDVVDDDGYVYCEINGGMYGLKQAGMIANRTLCERISQDGYYECKHTPGLFRHKTRQVWFCLVVDDFFAGYVGKENADHLISALRRDYSATVDWDAKTLLWYHHEMGLRKTNV